MTLYPLLRSLLFRLEAETAHELAASQMMRVQSVPSLLQLVRHLAGEADASLRRELWGLSFRNPLGIAAGFDKNALLMPFLEAIGFGWIEVGTVTLQPQPGNPRPRLFRFKTQAALVNRLGFNNDGAAVVANRLEESWNNVEQNRGTSVERSPIFVNVGKNRDVPLEGAADAYAECYEKVGLFADGVVLNLSSPNTPGLRDLQRPEHLEEILGAVRQVRDRASFARPGVHPIVVKIAPDLDDTQLAEICEVCVRMADGMTATNTTIDKSALGPSGSIAGGLSGRPLFARSTAILRKVRNLTGPSYPLIGVGGIFTADDARAKLAGGADLLQAYTALIYEGPAWPARLLRELAEAR